MRGIAFWLALSLPAAAACAPYTAARKYIGDSACIEGKVVKVASSPRSGTHFLNFCEDFRRCPFSVVVFAKDLARVGDVRQLEGREIQIYGKVREYKGQAEIILKDVRQLKDGSAKIPPVPKEYDAANRGRYSAGKLSASREKRAREKRPRRDPTTTEPPEEPER